MSDQIREWLDESQRLAAQATDGPWEVYGFNVLAHLGPGNCNGCSGILSPAHLPECGLCEVAEAGKPDAEFIAESRTRLPQAVAALREVMELHQPFRWSFGQGPVTSCRACFDAGASEAVSEWPCQTARAVAGALGLEGDNDD